MDKNLLIMLIGLPRSGKTTWAKKQGFPIVSPDSIRLALHGNRFIDLAEPFVWAIAKVMVYALFLSGHKKVILDATNNTNKRRQEWRSDKWDIKYEIINTPKEECIKRAKELNDEAIIPIIEKMAKEHEPLDIDNICDEPIIER